MIDVKERMWNEAIEAQLAATRRPPRWIALVGVLALALLLVACGTDSHVSGVVTDTTQQYFWCGKSSCTETFFVVNGKQYEDDWDDIRKGDYVSFDYNTVTGISNMHDGTQHPPDYTWVWVLVALVAIIAVGYGVFRVMMWLDQQPIG